MSKTKQKKRQVRVRAAEKSRRKVAAASKRRWTQSSILVSGLSDLPIQESKVNENFRDSGLAFVWVNRQRNNGRLVGAAYLIDVWGIGLKDCFRTEDILSHDFYTIRDLDETFGAPLVDCDEDLARQLVWGGLWRTRAEGFRTPKEFRSCRKLLAKLSEEEVDRSLFGKDGKTLIIGDLEDLKQRSTAPLELERGGRDYFVGEDLSDEVDPWEELFEEDDTDLGPGKERVLFIEGTFYGKNFQSLHASLQRWADLEIIESDEAGEWARFSWTREYPENHWSPFSSLSGARQSLGEIQIQATALTVNVRGKSWMLIMMSRLLEEFASPLVRGPLKITDPMDILNQEQRAV